MGETLESFKRKNAVAAHTTGRANAPAPLLPRAADGKFASTKGKDPVRPALPPVSPAARAAPPAAAPAAAAPAAAAPAAAAPPAAAPAAAAPAAARAARADSPAVPVKVRLTDEQITLFGGKSTIAYDRYKMICYPLNRADLETTARLDGFATFSEFTKSRLKPGDDATVCDLFETVNVPSLFKARVTGQLFSKCPTSQDWGYDASLRQFYMPSRVAESKMHTIRDALNDQEKPSLASAFDKLYAEFTNRDLLKVYLDARKAKELLEIKGADFITHFHDSNTREQKQVRHDQMRALMDAGHTTIQTQYENMLEAELNSMLSEAGYPLPLDAKPLDRRQFRESVDVYIDRVGGFDDAALEIYLDNRETALDIGEKILSFDHSALIDLKATHDDLEKLFTTDYQMPNLWKNKFKLTYENLQKSATAIENAANAAKTQGGDLRILAQRKREARLANEALKDLEKERNAISDRLAAEKLANKAANKASAEAIAEATRLKACNAQIRARLEAPHPIQLHPIHTLPHIDVIAREVSKDFRDAAEDKKASWLFPQAIVDHYMRDIIPPGTTVYERLNLKTIDDRIEERVQELRKDLAFKNITPKDYLVETILNAVKSCTASLRVKHFTLKESASDQTKTSDYYGPTHFGKVLRTICNINPSTAYWLRDLKNTNSNDVVKGTVEAIMPIMQTDDKVAVERLVKTTIVHLLTYAGHFCEETASLPQEVMFHGFDWDFETEFLLIPKKKEEAGKDDVFTSLVSSDEEGSTEGGRKRGRGQSKSPGPARRRGRRQSKSPAPAAARTTGSPLGSPPTSPSKRKRAATPAGSPEPDEGRPVRATRVVAHYKPSGKGKM
jgi:hypothetical protein